MNSSNDHESGLPFETPPAIDNPVPVKPKPDGDDPGWVAQQPTFFGHPVGLFVLFFAEMWERFSYYGMRALLVFYMTKGFLGYGDSKAYSVYGAYTALVYMTPFFGGMIADRIVGPRIAVILGGLLMAAGHLLMGVQDTTMFFLALALLIAGNGFFKPNISSMVGALYPQRSEKRDGGFTIFYIGINLGAAMSPLLCGYIGETFGNYHLGFGLATIGMLVGLAVFVAPTRIAMLLILAAAIASGLSMLVFRSEGYVSLIWNSIITICLVAGALVSVFAINQGGLPTEVGRPKNPEVESQGPASRIDRHRIRHSDLCSVRVGLPNREQRRAVAGDSRGHDRSAQGGHRAHRARWNDSGRAQQTRRFGAGHHRHPVVRIPAAREFQARSSRAGSHDRRAHADLLLDALLVVLRAGRQ
ncbi:MAG: peptide MFS transporter [Pirellulaceae bacterium]